MTSIKSLIPKSSHRVYARNRFLNQAQATARPCFTCIGRDYSTTRRTTSNNVDIISSKSSNLHLWSTSPLLVTTHLLNHRLYSSSTSKDVSASSSTGSGINDTSGIDGNDLLHKAKEVWASSVNVASQTGEKAKEALDEVTPHVEQLLNTYPYLRDVVVPVSGTIMGTILAWAILPRIFRRFHKYSTEGSSTILPVGSLWGAVPYEKSFWGALESPVKSLITFMAFSQMSVTFFFFAYLYKLIFLTLILIIYQYIMLICGL